MILKSIPKTFSRAWKSSTQVRKQRKYRYNAPLHLRQKRVHVHLSPALRQKYGFRNIQVRKGDKVTVLRGSHQKKEGKVERVLLKRNSIFVNGIETIKKDGSKVPFPLLPSKLMIIELDVSDKLRKQKLESKKKTMAATPAKDHKKQGKGNLP
ncbi:MAG: 50S ribosomal protein L24 [Nanoarchaeota archaeon]|nr:50S ribosomal protein L24 [Nanoarchaeota archaeon]